MIKVKTKLGVSNKKGIGLFADELIPKGSIVGINTDQLSIIRYSEKEWENLKNNLTEESFRHIKKYAYKNKEDNLYWLNLDNTRFINH
ncbi:MAG TPA: SET domain-containing protein, partial [Candidatus Paceibacterota bacterium]|nr:SET domain-containing protein [Candidatus Paceibacterota bacterium]